MDTSLVVDAVVDLVKAQYFDTLGIPVGDGEAPDLSALTAESLTTPHIVLYEIPIGAAYEGEGWSGGQGQEWVRLQITTVGIKADQVRALAASVQNTITDRNPADTSQWIHPITAAGHTVINRRKTGKIPTDSAGLGVRGGRLVDLLVQFTG